MTLPVRKIKTKIRSGLITHIEISYVNNFPVSALDLDKLIDIALDDFDDLFESRIVVEVARYSPHPGQIGISFDLENETKIPDDYVSVPEIKSI